MLKDLAEFLRAYWGAWLMLVFVGILFWAFRPKNRAKFEAHGNIPLRDDEDKER